MHLFHSLADLPAAARGGAVSVGNFDGVHRGHARLAEQLVALAKDLGGPAVIFTFDPHPIRILRPDAAPPPLTWAARKAALLGELGVDFVVSYPTDRALLSRSAAEFFSHILHQGLGARGMVEGPNFFFGRNREGDIARLGELCAAADVRLKVIAPELIGDEWVSSSRIREAIQKGDVEQAAAWLTRPYRIRGQVIVGAQRGATLGFPTANVDAIDTLSPAPGVYAARAYTQSGVWPAAVNIGANPTFGEDRVKFETHLIDFSGDLYGQTLEVEFVARLRETQPFPSVAELQRQLQTDVARARALCR